MTSSKHEGQEKRRHPRLAKKLPIKVKADTFDLVTETENISLSGVCCTVDKHIPPMVKTNIIMLLPIKKKNQDIESKKITCQGVVVRAHESSIHKGKYNIALYFTDMKKTDLNTIRRYLESHKEQSPDLAS